MVFSVLTVFIALTSLQLLVVVCSSNQTGLIQIRQSSENPYDCSQSHPIFVCTTSGLGETRISLSSVDGEPLRFRHSKYRNGSTSVAAVEGAYHELVAAVNLTRSTDRECFDRLNNIITDSFCYTTTFIVHLTDRTICSTVDCSTVFHNGTHEIPEQFGSDTITIVPPAPANLRVIHQSLENITFTWDPVTKNCSNVHYNVSILNCGRCPPNTNTTDNSFTCKHPVPGQRCNISIQTVQPCGLSDPATWEVLIESESTSAPVIRGKPNIIGAITGGIIALLLLISLPPLILIILCIILCTKKNERSLKSSDDPQSKTKEASSDTHISIAMQERPGNYQKQHEQDDAKHQEIKEVVCTESANAVEITEKLVTAVHIQDDSHKAQFQQHKQDVVKIQEIKDNLVRVHTKLENARLSKNKAEKRQSIAQEELQQAQNIVFRLEREQEELEKQIELHKDDFELKDVLVRSLERANSDLVNAGRRKDEAARNEAVAYKKMQQAHDEEHSLSLEENKIMEQVNVYNEAIDQRAPNYKSRS